MRGRAPFAAGIALAALVITSMAMFTVDQRQFAIVLQLGEIKDVVKEPGLRFKWPLIQNVRFFERRIMTFESPEPERFITSEKKNVLVDAFVKWRIIDPRLYYISVSGDETRAQIRIAQTVNAGLREEFGKRTVHEVVSGQREDIMEQMRSKADADTRKIGVQIIDVRLKRVDLPTEVSESVYRRMEAERKRVANELRSQGAAEAERIRADADRQREIIIAEAYRDAQKLKGEGDAKATAIYAHAFGRNPEFYSFYRSLEAYRQSFRNKSDMMVLEPSSDFFKYLRSGVATAAKPKR
ncbi:MAG TPA: protease modulator HflC [Rhodocyclaceae bacterium]|nr:MAG: HflC protein [Betaproteobacteria bacterium CG2_30_68_42]PIV73205.1 MAG: protease modulator HflC [Rhodocyclales bacterium CG17_big_fil_post_rev_8_21_14_2_50_68_7]PJA56455.1 MAG: protease modulator HflC [Rhodocyclales bacterium CG_4_9_14_3_um_filter_68_10]HCX33130.1 protease modulator HflC [Rhodocyclaceae bacterium]